MGPNVKRLRRPKSAGWGGTGGARKNLLLGREIEDRHARVGNKGIQTMKGRGGKVQVKRDGGMEITKKWVQVGLLHCHHTSTPERKIKMVKNVRVLNTKGKRLRLAKLVEEVSLSQFS